MGKQSPTSGWKTLVSSSSGARRALWPPPAWPPLGPCHLRGARRHLLGARRLSRRLPGGRRSRARPRRRLIRRLRGSGRGGRRLPPLGRSPTPIVLLLLIVVRQRVLRSPGGGEPLLLTQPELLAPLFPALPSPDPPLLLARHSLLLSPLHRARAWARGVGGSHRAAFTAITCRGRVKPQITAMVHEPKDRRRVRTLLAIGPSGSMVNAQNAMSSTLMALRLTARLA
jgi:hypothetical protein